MEHFHLALFAISSLAVIITPGQDLLLVMSRAVAMGPRAGVITASGVSIGLVGHSIIAAFGLGALLLASKTLFTILKFVGASYLLFLGIRLIFSKSHQFELNSEQRISHRKLFFTGAFSNISNPHITIFYFAFLPQFIPANAVDPAQKIFILGLCFALLTFMIKGPLGYFAGLLSSWLRTHPSVLKWVNRTSGAMMIGLGLRLALERSR